MLTRCTGLTDKTETPHGTHAKHRLQNGFHEETF
jgi:hypothetical protein